MKINITFITLLLTVCITAQNGLSYKALIKDSNGNVVSNQDIDLRFSIQFDDGSGSGTTFYEERQTITADQNGIIILEIGEGAATFGDFATIPWERANLLNIQIDIEQDGTFVDFGGESINPSPRTFYAIRAREADNVSGLELINEGGSEGWRLLGRDPNFYGDIGLEAVDFSYSGTDDQQYGATGLYSLAAGAGTIASGSSSVALGQLNIASGDFSTALGRTSTATGDFSAAIGQSANASGSSSIAMGSATTASGSSSTALGSSTIAEGRNSTAMGTRTTATAYSSVAVGRYNVGGGDTNNWSDFDPLFEVGNGSSNSNRNNALLIRKNGQHEINSTGIGLVIPNATEGIYISDSNSSSIFINNSGGRSLLIDNSGSDGIAIDNSQDDGIIITGPQNNGLSIFGAANDGVVAFGNGYGGRFSGDEAGVYASGDVSEGDIIPDLILGSSDSSIFSDDGIISTNPARLGSDMFLRSYDAVVVQLDYDNNEAGNFRIRNGAQDVVFDVTESGNLSFDGNLELGTGIVECPFPDIRMNSNDDVLVVLDTDTNETGFFGIYNGSTSNSVFQVLDTGDAFLSGTLTQSSDKRLKRDIKDLGYGLEEILQLRPKQYYWKDKTKNKKSIGLIAQDVQAVITEVVNIRDDDINTLGVNYIEIIPVLIKAIQEQQELISNQTNNITKLKKELIVLKEGFESLKTELKTKLR